MTHIAEQEDFNKLMDQVFNNKTTFKTNPNLFIYTDNSKELKEFRNSSDYEQMWEIAIDKWTRNWNFYREHLTDSILEKFQLNNKRQKRQTKDYVELFDWSKKTKSNRHTRLDIRNKRSFTNTKS